MKTCKKCIAVILSLFVSTFGMPVLANVEPEAVKTQLSDEALAQAVGGNYEARILTRLNANSDVVQAMFINNGGSLFDGSISGSGCTGSYSFQVLNLSGTVVQTLATGNLGTGQSIVVGGTVLPANNNNQSTLRATMACTSVPHMRVETTSRRIN